MIKFLGITKIYSPDIIALRRVSFEIKRGEFVSIVGRSGAGKTTLIKILLKEEEPTEGRVIFKGEDISKIPKRDISLYRQNFGPVFQDYKLLELKTVYENVAYAMELMGAADREIERDVNQVLDIVGLQEKTNSFPNELSGGEKQRVAIARALVIRPEVLVADEPTGNLDPYSTKDIVELLKRINEFGTTVILATHDKEVIDNLNKRTITLEDGKLIRDEAIGQFIL